MDKIASLGIGNWGTKGSKHGIIKDICEVTHSKSLDISVLSIKELNRVKASICGLSQPLVIETPNSRNKAPYIALIEPHIPGVALNKLSVSSLKELIGILNTCGTEK